MIKTQTNTYDSSTVEASTYDYTNGQLFVTFKHATYLYLEVASEDYELFKGAESQGKALNEFIKPKYKFQKLELE